MKFNKKILICALLVLMILCCVNAASAAEPLNDTLETSDAGVIALDEQSDDALSASGDTYVVDANGGGDYTTISSAVSAATGGETIFIKNGEYTETAKIDIGAKQLTFTGESQDGVIIKSGDNDLFYTTTSGYSSLVISGLTFKDISMTGARTPIFVGGDGNVNITDCTFDNCASRYGGVRIYTSGTVTIDNCKFLNTKSSTGSYSSAIDFGGSSTSEWTIKNTIIDGSSISSASTATYIFGAIYNERNTGLVTLDNVTITNCNLEKSSGLISTKGNMNIKRSELVNNYVYRDLAIAGLIFVNGAKTVTIESSLIANNTQPNHILTANSAATFDLNYNNIQGNTFNTAFTNANNGVYTLDSNYWGSNTVPEGITATTWIVENNGEYTLNNGEPLEKEVPGLTPEGSAVPEGTIYVSADGNDENDGLTEATAVATIVKAVELANNSTGNIIILEGTYDCPQIEITQDLTISTSGEVLLKAQDATKKAFFIKSGDVKISDLTFTNFNASYTGSVIRVTGGSLTLDGVNFTKNGGEFRDSIVYVRNADLTLTNCIFEENTGHKTSTSYGIVNVGTGTLYVEDCQFINNYNKYGAIYLSSSIAEVHDTVFIGNNATSSSGGSGAAIFVGGTSTYISSYSGNLMNGSASYVWVEGCSFINNTAFGARLYAGQGGAIYVNNNVTMFINDCIFENNKCTDNTGDTYKPSQGGAIYASAGKVIIDGSTFLNNDATQGPEIYMRYYNSHLHPEEVNWLEISNSVILNDGVAVIADSDNGTYIANDNWWGTNDEPSDKVANVTVDTWAIFDASMTPSPINDGQEATITATFSNDELPDDVIDVAFTSNSGNLDEVVSAVDGKASTKYTIVAADENISVSAGSAVINIPVLRPYTGIVYVNATGSDDNKGSIDAPVATIGKALEIALAEEGSKQIIIDEGTYVGNGYHITDDVTVTGNGKVTLDANNEGRLFYMEYGDNANKIELSNLILTNAKGYGAAVYSFAKELILDNVTIVNNQADGYLIKSNGKLTIKDSNITNSMSGNVIQQDASGDILINNTVFENNSIVDTTSVMAVVNINSGSGNLVVENSKFINNTARQGVIKGNFYYNIDVKGSEFIDNTNTVAYGGAIYINGGNLNINDSVFVNNKAYRSGGAIYVGYRVTANVDKCLFINNTANTMGEEYYGDAIYNGNKLTVNNSALLGDAKNYMIYNDGEDNVVNAQNNWWGTNDNPKDLNGFGYYEDDEWEDQDCPEVDVANWVTMNATLSSFFASVGSEINATATFSNPNLVNGVPVRFTSNSGKLDEVALSEDGKATIAYTVDASDNAITATSGNVSIVLPLLNGVVTQDTYLYYFNQEDNGKLFDYIPDGATLDFQGSIINPDTNNVVQMNVNKPVNIISSTKDAYVDLNTTAGSLLGESPGNSFAVTNGGSGSNVTGIYLHNTQLWIANTHDVVLDNISVVVEDQRVGSGVGATSIRENSSNVILKNSYLYTRNNGGSTTFTMSWTNNCTIDNCTVKAEGNVGNLIYLNIFNIAGAPSGVPLNNYNTVSNNRIYGKEGSGISVGLMVEGQNNLIINNTLYKSSIGTSFGGVNPYNNTYVGNTMTEGSGMTAQIGSIVYNNNVTGALSTGKESVAYDNVVGKAITVGADAVAYNNTAASATISGKNSAVENNTFGGAVTISGAGVTFIGNNVTGTVTVNSNNNVVKGNNITTTGDYAVDLKTKTGNNVTENYLVATLYKGDLAVKSASETNIVENNLPLAPIVVDAESVWIGNNATVTVTVANTTGTVTISVNGKEETLDLVDGVASIEVPAEDLVVGVNNVTATYNGPEYVPATVEDTIVVVDGVVTQETYRYYFNQEDNGKLFDYIPDGATLDFQGSIINPSQALIVQMNVNKPVNIISTTKDAYVDLNTTSGSLLGESPGNSFAITNGGSGTNVTGITFHNTQLWLANTHNVVLDNISAIVEDQRVGSGVGATSIRENSTYVTVKNSYFYTRNNGGSSSLVLAWADYCTWDNNTIEVEGNVGNILYLNTFNVNIPSGVVANQHNVITNNVIIKPGSGSAICWGIAINGKNNLIENNTIYYQGVGIAAALGGTSNSNVFKGNKLYNGSSIAGMGSYTNCTFEDNYVTGALNQIDADCKIINNTLLKTVNIRGANVEFINNTLIGGMSTKVVTATNKATNLTFTGNNITGYVGISANSNTITGNMINTTYSSAITLASTTGNVVTDNVLFAQSTYGDAAVKYNNADNVVENNRPFVTDLVVSAEDIQYGQTAVINVSISPNATGTVKVEVNGVEYPVEIVDGQGQVEVSGLDINEYEVTATFETDDITQFHSTENATSFKVDKFVSTIEVSTADVTYPEKVIVTVKSDVAGYYVVTIGEESKDLVLKAGIAKDVKFGGLDANEEGYVINVTYAGNDQYADNYNDTVSVKVFKADSSVTVYPVDDVVYPADVEVIYSITNRNDVTVELVNVDTGDVIDVPAESITNNIINLEGLAAGNYIITVINNEGTNYKASNASAEFKVIIYSSSVTIDPIENVTYGQDVVVTYTVENETTISIVVKDGEGNEITEGIDTSVAGTVTISGLDVGDYTITIANAAEGSYEASNASAEFSVGDIEISADVDPEAVWIGNGATINVNITTVGTVTIEVNGKSYDVEIVDGVATKEIPAEDLIAGENTITATYAGPNGEVYSADDVVFVADGVVTQDTYLYYFNQEDNGKLFDYIPDGATLDFQGSIINPDQALTVQMNVNKPVNIISTTKDAYVDLNTTAGSLLGESPGNSFAVTNGGSGSNVTGVYFHNTQVWIANTHDVVLDNISVVVEDQRVGSGVGATSIRENSSNVILKNSYLYTRNNGGSTTFTMSWTTNCTIDNCTVKAEGNVGNLIYLNIFNINGAPSGVPLNNYNTVSNNRIYGKEGSGISVGLMVEGQNNLIVNNTLYKSSISTSFGGANPYNNTYVGNTMTDGSGLTAQAGSIIYNNNVTGALSTGKESVAYDNIVGKAITVGANAVAYNNTAASATISGAGAVAYDNTIATTATVSGKNADVENNTFGGAVTISGAGVTFIGNNVTGTVTVNSNDNVIKANNINTTGTYAVDLKTKTGNNVTDNLLIASELKGDSAVSSASETNIVENNYPVTSDLAITVEDIVYGEDAIVNVEFNPKATGTIVVSIDGTEYTVNITSEGQGSAIISGLAAKDYEVTATFTPDSIYSLDSDANASFTVFKANVTMEAAADSVKADDDVLVNVTFDKADVTGDVSITIDGTEYTATIENGAATIVIPGLVAGEYAADVIYAGDENYNDTMASVSFEVGKYTVDFTKAKGHPGRVDKNATVEVILSESDATGTVSINIDGVDYSADLVDGKAVIYAPLLPAGTYYADVIYSGDGKYENNTAPITFNVNKYYPTMKATADDVQVDENAIVNVVLPSDATGTVTITVDGVDYTADVVDGTASVELPVIADAGDHSFNVSYSGDDKYRTQTTTVEFNVLKYNADIKATARTVKIGNNVTVNVVLPSDATGEVSIIINDTVYTGTVEDGAAAIVIPDLGVGSYALPVEYSGDGKYNPANTTVTFNVNKQTTSMKATARTVKVGDDVTVNVALASDATGEVSIDVNGTVYTAEVVDGAASIVIPDLPYGQYAFDVVYSGDDKYKTRTATVTFNVNKQTTTMKATARTVKVGDDVTVNVALASDATGDVIITIDGVDYTATVVDGVASIVISDLPADQYSLEVKYSGDDKYKNRSSTVTFNVNKYNVKMKATAKYYSDGDYSIVNVALSDDATGEVSTSVNGNDYTVNVVDGSALIVISGLPAGDYPLDVVYSGDDKYKNYTVATTLKVVK